MKFGVTCDKDLLALGRRVPYLSYSHSPNVTSMWNGGYRFQLPNKSSLMCPWLGCCMWVCVCVSVRETDLSSAELESGNAPERFIWTPTPVLDKISGPIGAQLYSSIGLGLGVRIGRAQLLPIPALDKNK